MASGLIRSLPSTPRLLHGPLVRPHLTLLPLAGPMPASRAACSSLCATSMPLVGVGMPAGHSAWGALRTAPARVSAWLLSSFFQVSAQTSRGDTPSPQLFSLKSTQLPSCSLIPYLYLSFFLSYGDLFSPWLYSLLAILYLLPIVLPRTHAP